MAREDAIDLRPLPLVGQCRDFGQTIGRPEYSRQLHFAVGTLVEEGTGIGSLGSFHQKVNVTGQFNVGGISRCGARWAWR